MPYRVLTGSGAAGATLVGALSLGDVDGNGYEDVGIVESTQGPFILDVYLVGPDGLPAVPSQVVTNTAPLFGIQRTIGDFNGDGYSDVAFLDLPDPGVPQHFYVYLGGPTGLPSAPSAVLAVPDSDAPGNTAFLLRSAGDVNGDGYDDLALGVDIGDGGAGRVAVYLGGAQGLSSTPAFTLRNPNGSWQFGDNIGTASDINGDGFGDLVISNVGYSADVGVGDQVFVYRGSPAGISAQPSQMWTSPDPGYTMFGIELE
jgi:hypothetical protein